MKSDRAVPSAGRRRFLTACGGAMAATCLGARTEDAQENAELAAAFDAAMEGHMTSRGVPGGALAVLRNGRLIYARGYGVADRERGGEVDADSRFRIASISKPLTAVAIFRLAEAGRLSPDDRVLDLLADPPQVADPRLSRVTLRQLMQHTGGWDRATSGDPMFRSREIAEALGIESPPSPADIIRHQLSKPLDFEPGSRSAYSNFGYCLLGRVIEARSGMGYEEFVKQDVLAPIGVGGMRLGRSLAGQRVEGEVTHHMPAGADLRESVFGAQPERVAWPDGGFCLESMDAHGAWLASARDLARFAAALDSPANPPLLKPESLREMYLPPAAPAARDEDGTLQAAFPGCGWMVRPVGREGRANLWHNGSLPGSFALLVRRADGLTWIALFNQRSDDPALPDMEIDAALHRAADAVREWPRGVSPI